MTQAPYNKEVTTRKGFTLIEVLFAAAVVSVGLLVLYFAFVQASTISSRNAANSLGLTILNTAIDSDSKVTYASFSNNPSTTDVPELPDGKLYRSVDLTTICEPVANPMSGVKVIHYTLHWNGADGEHNLQAEYELVNKGLNNNPGA